MSLSFTPPSAAITEEQIAHQKNIVTGVATRSERMSWDRKMNSMIQMVAKVTPIEQQITDLIAVKQPLMDEIAELRQTMVRECIHPAEMLEYKEDNSIVCKFCDRKFWITTQQPEQK